MNFEDLMNDREFAMQVNQAASAEEVVALFAGKGIELPAEAAQEMFNQPEGELDEGELETVAGGFISYLIWRAQGCNHKTAMAMCADVWKNGGDGQKNKGK